MPTLPIVVANQPVNAQRQTSPTAEFFGQPQAQAAGFAAQRTEKIVEQQRIGADEIEANKAFNDLHAGLADVQAKLKDSPDVDYKNYRDQWDTATTALRDQVGERIKGLDRKVQQQYVQKVD